MAGVEELRAQLREAEEALAANPADAELRQLTVELRALIQSAGGAGAGEPEGADEGRCAPPRPPPLTPPQRGHLRGRGRREARPEARPRR